MQARTVQAAMQGGKPYDIEYRIIDALGTERWVAENGQPQRDEATGAAWIDGIISDISERKHNEMRIQGLLAEQSAILDNVMFG
ncbi:PAS domain-containing protein, partial [Pseudoxanthomonas sp. KAs_5_3]